METVAYCELIPARQAVLMARMADGYLDTAPVFGDIKDLTKEALLKSPAVAAAVAEFGEDEAIECVIAGFPCTDACLAGKRKGMQGDQTVLVKQVVRLVKELNRPKYILLENVKAIVTLPDVYEYVIECFTELGYKLRWCTLNAKNVGSPQERGRWFCWLVRCDVAAQHGMELPFVPAIERSDLEDLVQEPWNGVEPGVDELMLKSSSPKVKARLTMLGMLASRIPPTSLRAPLSLFVFHLFSGGAAASGRGAAHPRGEGHDVV